MPKKTEMPEDVRRMTAEMRKAYENSDTRPQLRRGNPKAVSAAETTAQLRAIRENTPSISAGNIRNYLTRKAQKLTPFIDHGLADMYTAPMFDINQMALDAKDMTPRDALRLFYGDRTDEIVDRAMALRARFNNYEASEDELRGMSPMNYALPIRNKPSKGETSKGRTQRANNNTLKEIADRYPKARSFISFISWLIDRPYASLYRGGAHTAHDKSAAGHERFGHNLNPATNFAGNTSGRDKFANDNELLLTNLYAIIGDGQAFYTHRNQNEFAAAFGNLRKSIYKRSEGKLDIADPVVFERVVEDYANHPGTYSGSWLTDDSRELLNTGSSYPGLLVPADKGTIERGYEIEEALGDPDYTHQFVKNSNTNNSKAAAAKGGNTPGLPKSSAVPKGHNPALDGYSGPRVVINPQVMKDDRDALCVAFNESFRIIQEINGFDPVAEPTEKQRAFFADTAYRDDERMLRRTILSRICTFDTSVTDPTDEQLQEAVEFLDTVLEIGAPQNQWEQRAVERIRTAIERSVGQPRTEEENPKPPAEGPAVAAAGGGETEEEALTRLAAGDTGKTLQEDTSTIEEREEFLEERGMDKSLAETGSMDTLVKMHEQQNGVPPADATQTRPDAPATDAKTDGKSALTNADVLASKDAVEFVAANGGGTTGNGISVDAGAKVMDDGRIIGSDGNARNADGKIDNFGRSGETLAEMQQQANPVQEQHEQNHPQTASERIGTTSGIKGLGGRELTAGEAAWQARKQASTAAWMQRTGRSSDGVADALQDTNNQQQAPAAAMDVAQNSPQTASERIGTTSGIKGLGGRELTAGEAAWQARKQASTAAWMQRTGRSSDGVADALAQRDERANNLRQNSQVDSGRRDLLGRRLDDRGRVIV